MFSIVFMLALNQGIAPAQAGRSEPGRRPEDIPPSATGLRGESYTDTGFEKLGTVRTDWVIDFQFKKHQPPYTGGQPIKPNKDGFYEHFAIRWSGRIVAASSETYTFHVHCDDGVLLWIDGRLVISGWQDWGSKKDEFTGTVKLRAGKDGDRELRLVRVVKQ